MFVSQAGAGDGAGSGDRYRLGGYTGPPTRAVAGPSLPERCRTVFELGADPPTHTKGSTDIYGQESVERAFDTGAQVTHRDCTISECWLALIALASELDFTHIAEVALRCTVDQHDAALLTHALRTVRGQVQNSLGVAVRAA